MNKDIFYQTVKPFSMTSEERINGLFESLEYVRKNNIIGDIVECGVWKGGNILGIIEYLEYYKIYDKNVWVYDTFKGMTLPSSKDIDHNGNIASDIINEVMCYSPIEEVKQTLSLSKFKNDNIKIIEGDVCLTLKLKYNLPSEISILRLDTDFYESTKIEMDILYPLLVKNGVLIVDDYGHWEGSKLAINEYFKNYSVTINKLDYTGIKIIKE